MNEKLATAKAFVARHKAAIIVGTTVVIGTAVAYAIANIKLEDESVNIETSDGVLVITEA